MQIAPSIPTTTAGLRAHLEALQRERTLAGLTGLASVASYMHDLEDELASTEAAYVGAAVTEIATLRAAVGAPLEG